MIDRLPVRVRSLALAIVAICASSGIADARQPASFDINVQHAASKRTGTPSAHHDALGRSTFRWVRQALPATAKSATLDPEAAARLHLAVLLGGAKRAGDPLALRKIDRQRGGAALVQFEARIDGIEIFHERLALLLDREQQLIATRGPLPSAADKSAATLPAFTLDAADALARVLREHGFAADIGTRLPTPDAHGEFVHFRLGRQLAGKHGARAIGEQRARRVWFRTGAGLQPAWYVETSIAERPDAAADGVAQVMSAIDGQLLFRTSLTAEAQAFDYRVWAEDGADRLPYPNPHGRNGTPDPDGLPTNDPAAFEPQALRTLANAPFSRAATDGWLPAAATVTRGNNVDAYADIVEPDGFGDGDLQPTTTAARTFDYPFNSLQGPTATPTQRLAATVQMFYWVNWLHDGFYDHGFAESDGNAQADNFGRGGLGGDRIVAEAQDFDTAGNANMLTPSDGGSPRMQMGLGAPGRDTTVDGQVVAHEWGHYMTNRLVGDATGLSTEQAAGLGEGWGDFIAMLATVKDDDQFKAGNAGFAGAYGMFGYAFRDSWAGARRYPYSTDLSRNPLQMQHLSDDTPLPSTPTPRFGASGIDNSEVHNQGEVWASALWDCYAALLNDRTRLDFAEAQNRMKDYLVGSLKMTPVTPTIVEARDALLATVLAAGEQQDFALFTAAFARRGLGAGARVPDRYSDTMHGITASTSVGNALAVTAIDPGVAVGCDTDSVLDGGEAMLLTLTVANTGFGELAAATVTVDSDDPAIIFPAGQTLDVPRLPATGSIDVQLPIRLQAGVATDSVLRLTATPDAPDIVSPPGTAALQLFVHSDAAAASSVIDEFDALPSPWRAYAAPIASGNGSWSGGSEDTTRFIHGDDGNSRAVIWWESPTMDVGSGPLTITLTHRHAFEFDDNVPYDGGVVEVSIDDGETWSALDPALAGFGNALSDCCGNPLAGRPAYTGQTAGYPAFSTMALDLGTAFADQPRFRIRFGIATDAAVSRNGWDINRIVVDGLDNTPFTTIVDQAASCSVPTYKPLQGSLGGAYYDAARSGEGIMIDLGQINDAPFAFFSWYSYDAGRQLWLVGGDSFTADDRTLTLELVETSGANFGNDFDPNDVARKRWGSASIAFPDCDTVELTYRKAGGEAGTLTMDRGLGRLAHAECGTLHGGMSGIYHAPERDGEGVLVEFGTAGGGPFEFFTWYSYGSGAQQWLVGGTPFAVTDAAITIALQNSSGAQFGSGFRSEDVVRSPWGELTQRFIDCNTMEIDYRTDDGEAGTLQLTRGLQTLGDGVCR